MDGHERAVAGRDEVASLPPPAVETAQVALRALTVVGILEGQDELAGLGVCIQHREYLRIEPAVVVPLDGCRIAGEQALVHDAVHLVAQPGVRPVGLTDLDPLVGDDASIGETAAVDPVLDECDVVALVILADRSGVLEVADGDVVQEHTVEIVLAATGPQGAVDPGRDDVPPAGLVHVHDLLVRVAGVGADQDAGGDGLVVVGMAPLLHRAGVHVSTEQSPWIRAAYRSDLGGCEVLRLDDQQLVAARRAIGERGDIPPVVDHEVAEAASAMVDRPTLAGVSREVCAGGQQSGQQCAGHTRAKAASRH